MVNHVLKCTAKGKHVHLHAGMVTNLYGDAILLFLSFQEEAETLKEMPVWLLHA